VTGASAPVWGQQHEGSGTCVIAWSQGNRALTSGRAQASFGEVRGSVTIDSKLDELGTGSWFDWMCVCT
jgi:hypothetical protein